MKPKGNNLIWHCRRKFYAAVLLRAKEQGLEVIEVPDLLYYVSHEGVFCYSWLGGARKISIDVAEPRFPHVATIRQPGFFVFSEASSPERWELSGEQQW